MRKISIQLPCSWQELSAAERHIDLAHGDTALLSLTLPLATTAQSGLMTADHVQQLNRIENKLNALLGVTS